MNIARSFVNCALFRELCNQMRFEVDCVESRNIRRPDMVWEVLLNPFNITPKFCHKNTDMLDTEATGPRSILHVHRTSWFLRQWISRETLQTTGNFSNSSTWNDNKSLLVFLNTIIEAYFNPNGNDVYKPYIFKTYTQNIEGSVDGLYNHLGKHAWTC